MKLCQTCGTLTVKGSAVAHTDNWFDKKFPAGPAPFYQKGAEMKVPLEGLKPNTPIFFFAARHKPFSKIAVAARSFAYHTLENSGVTVSNEEGEAVFPLDCPQVYRNPEDKEIYPRHIHFSYWTGSQWSKDIYTRKIFCPVTSAEVRTAIDDGCHIIMDALPTEMHEKRSISGSVSIPAGGRVTQAMVQKAIKEGARGSVKRALAAGLSWKEVPIILYCFSPTCSAAEHLKEKLDAMGVVNTWHYEEGIIGWKGPVE
jgi:hypothetical protein